MDELIAGIKADIEFADKALSSDEFKETRDSDFFRKSNHGNDDPKAES